MAEANTVTYLKDMSCGHIGARHKQAVADVAAVQDHVSMVAGKTGKVTVIGHRSSVLGAEQPILVQRNCGDPTMQVTTEVLKIDGTSSALRALKRDESISSPLTEKIAEKALADIPVLAIPTTASTTPQAVPQAPFVAPVVSPTSVSPTSVSAVTSVTPKKPLKQVQINTKGFGKLRVFCQDVVISERVIALIYPNTGESAIVEPPSTEGTDQTITITVDSKSYPCVSLDMSYEYGSTLVVVLVRVPESA